MSPVAPSYRHTQIGWGLLIAVAAGAGIVVFAGSRGGWNPVAAAVLALLAGVGLLFCTLTVVIREGNVMIYFGPGLIRRRFERGEVVRVETVRNPWHFGWGIRFTPYGWLFNVSGLDAVELGLDSGKAVRIGTDEPRELAAAIRKAVGLAR
jgi:hypothetical protein